MQTQTRYDFPVALEPAYSRAGIEAPKIKLVVNTETNRPISSVSNRYRLTTHKELDERSAEFLNMFGPRKSVYNMSKDGAVMMAQHTYKDITTEMICGDMVGLRLFTGNSYNSSKKVSVRLGALILSCLNGAVSYRELLDISFKHTKDLTEIEWPTEDAVMGAFRRQVGDWNKLSKIRLAGTARDHVIEAALNKGVIPERALDSNHGRKGDSAWDLYNEFTYYITHDEKKSASPLGKINRLARVDRFFDKLNELVAA